MLSSAEACASSYTELELQSQLTYPVVHATLLETVDVLGLAIRVCGLKRFRKERGCEGRVAVGDGHVHWICVRRANHDRIDDSSIQELELHPQRCTPASCSGYDFGPSEAVPKSS